jgi:hypothetical protein
MRTGRYCPCVGKLNSKPASKQAGRQWDGFFASSLKIQGSGASEIHEEVRLSRSREVRLPRSKEVGLPGSKGVRLPRTKEVRLPMRNRERKAHETKGRRAQRSWGPSGRCRRQSRPSRHHHQSSRFIQYQISNKNEKKNSKIACQYISEPPVSYGGFHRQFSRTRLPQCMYLQSH